jgi:hypothetical protein
MCEHKNEPADVRTLHLLGPIKNVIFCVHFRTACVFTEE